MSSLSAFGWILLSLLTEDLAQTEIPQCALGPAQSSHPVRGLLERFEAGPGCSARESGSKETHVIAVGRASNGPENKVTVLLTPLFFSPGPLREIYLLLSSKKPVIWCLEGCKLPPQLTVMVQVSSKSTVQSNSLEMQVQTMHSLPFRPRALHRWALRHHGNITSLTHSAHSNHVYIKLGQDQNQTTACHLQSVFLSHNYMTSDLQPQEVQGCSLIPAGALGPFGPEVHIIKLYSAGSGLCGSLQVEVEVSLLPSVKSRVHNIVLVLSSSVPVNWAIVSRGIQGHVDIYSSNSVSPPFPPEPNLTVSSRLDAGLSTVSDLLLWARDRGYSTVTSYTEADLANRFRIHLTRPGTEVSPQGGRPPWVEEQRLRQWLSDSDVEDGESFTVHCNDGRLSVTMNQSILQRLSVPIAAITLRDATCQAQSNGSHFLLVFPVISCQTEGDLLGHSGGVQYKNTVFLWRDEPPTPLESNETELRSKGPLSIHFTCLAPALALISNDDGVGGSPPPVMAPWTPQGSKSEEQRKRSSPKHRPGPKLAMRLFVSEKYEEKRIGPCVITAEHRVYTEISAKEPLVEVIEVKSCFISPQSDPKKSPFWSVIWDGCPYDDSLILGPIIKHDNGSDEDEHMKKDIRFEESRPGGSKRDAGWTEKRKVSEEERTLRFSFIMRALYNESMQFLHCSLLLCGSDMTAGVSRAQMQDCQTGTRIPPLGSTATTQQCEIRNLSRPMVVTRPISSLAPKPRLPPAGQRFKRLSVSPLTSPDTEHMSSMVQIGPLLAIMFTAFVMGSCLMGGLWYIYSHTGPTPPREDDTMGGHSLLNPSSQSIQSNSSV
ncbi:transforming growth factor beta receptor type 3 [Eucyclogobius newberryi]|uniref:transforming growth factor beta receptor type 3 n=1 Tax=Eucyclogobius newberryi TaxID=166745 RepID=UPI003B5C2F59